MIYNKDNFFGLHELSFIYIRLMMCKTNVPMKEYSASPITSRAEYTLQGTRSIAIRSIRTNFRSIHSNTWTSKACVTWFTIRAAFCIRVCAISAKNVFFKCLGWTVRSFGARRTFSTASCRIRPSRTFHSTCFAFTTENSSMN